MTSYEFFFANAKNTYSKLSEFKASNKALLNFKSSAIFDDLSRDEVIDKLSRMSLILNIFFL